MIKDKFQRLVAAIKCLRQPNQPKINHLQWLMITILVAVLVILAFLASIIILFEIKYHDKFYPGSRLGNLSLEGLTISQAIELMEQTTQAFKEQGVKVQYDPDNYLTLTPVVSGLEDPDLSRELYTFDIYETIYQAYSYGREGSLWQNIPKQWDILLSNHSFTNHYDLNEAYLKELLVKQFKHLEQDGHNARPKITWQAEEFTVELEPATTGHIINYHQAIEAVKNRLQNLDSSPVKLSQTISQPEITQNQVQDKLDLVNWLLNTSSPKLIYQDQTWEINTTDLAKMLEFQKQDTAEIFVGMNEASFTAWAEATILDINQAPQDASLIMHNGKVTEFEVHQTGLAVDVRATYMAMNNNLAKQHLTTQVVVETLYPDILTEEINDLGIKEIIGTGHSNFWGSSYNRIHNIKTGANKLQGVLVEPGEDFSLVEKLIPVDASGGYLPELVIKGNETKPEYGGGLCQIGTTLFRAAMASGLPITERRGHGYSVSYYLEDGLPGTDATIYIPKPDVRFLNDTGHYVLIQYRIDGYNLYFDFWGTSDGRLASRTKPVTWGWTAPPPTKYIETLDLPVDEKKCTEAAHHGVSASFDYLVTLTDGTEKKQTFTTNYRPWQEVCLIGVAELSEKTASSTQEIIE